MTPEQELEGWLRCFPLMAENTMMRRRIRELFRQVSPEHVAKHMPTLGKLDPELANDVFTDPSVDVNLCGPEAIPTALMNKTENLAPEKKTAATRGIR